MSNQVPVIQGVLPALVTPYKADGSINYPTLRQITQRCMAKGCHGFFVCGTTGEGLLLSTDERKRVVETVIEECNGKLPVLVHVGALATETSVELAKHARVAGAAAVSSIPPIYYKVGLPGLVMHFKAIAEASELPTYLYHFPDITGVSLTGEQIVETFGSIEGVVGMKLSDNDLFLVWNILDAAKGKMSVLIGKDQLLYQALITGAAGSIGSTYNYQCESAVKLYNAYRAGNHAEAWEYQCKLNRIVRILWQHGPNLGVEKTILKISGIDPGAPRSPLPPFPADQAEIMRRELLEVGGLDS